MKGNNTRRAMSQEKQWHKKNNSTRKTIAQEKQKAQEEQRQRIDVNVISS